MINDQIIGKVKALLNMTEGHGCTEAEAATALSKAQELLFQHNLSMADVKTDDTIARPAGIGKIDGTEEHGYTWKRHLLGALAENTLCKVIGTAHLKQWHIFGAYDNVRSTLEMYHWIVPELERMAIKAWTEYKHNGGYDNARTWKQGFYLGAIEIIRKRLAESMKQFSAGAGHSLVIYNAGLVNDAVHRVFPNLVSRSISNGSYSGREAGATAGNGIHLKPQRKLSGTLALAY